MMASMVPNCTIPTVGAGVGREFTIAPDGDFVIRLTPPVTKPIAESPVNKPVARPRIFEFRVSRGILITHSAFFQHLFHVQPTLSIVSFENNNISRSLEIWLRAIHNDADNIHSAFRSLRARHSEQVWITIAVGQQFGFVPQHTTVLKPWFLAHYKDTLSTKGPGLIPFVARSLALPCALFDHAEGFMKLTKYLAFNTNSALFTENFQTLGVDARSLDGEWNFVIVGVSIPAVLTEYFLGPLTAARAHVQSTLERGLYYPLARLHSAVCVCRKETAFDYEDALISLGCWPLDDVAQKLPLSELFEKLTNFDFQPVGMGCESGECRRGFKRSVEIAISRAKQSFHGLCLDCMNRSKPVIGQSHEDYIKKNSPHVGYWDMDCRFGHGRPSWFVSSRRII
jgi:hypothetical protein